MRKSTTSKKSLRKQEQDLRSHDAQIWFRATTRTVAANLQTDDDRKMLATYVDYLSQSPAQERRELTDRLINELRLACDEKSKNVQLFKGEAALSVSEVFETIKFVRTRVGPDDGDLGRKLYGGDLDTNPAD